MAQMINPFENAFMFKNLLFFINNQSCRDESILNYLKSFNFIPQDNNGRTIVVNGTELYFMDIVENIFTIYSIDGKYVELTVSLLNTFVESIELMIKSKYASVCLANFISFKLCCYLPADKKVPFGFVQQSLSNSIDLFGNALPRVDMALYTKTFEFDEKYSLKRLSFEHLVDYSEMIRKFVAIPVQTNSMIVSPPAMPFFKKF